jgi:hypothetical protein
MTKPVVVATAVPQNRFYLNWSRQKPASLPVATAVITRGGAPSTRFPATRFYLKALAK